MIFVQPQRTLLCGITSLNLKTYDVRPRTHQEQQRPQCCCGLQFGDVAPLGGHLHTASTDAKAVDQELTVRLPTWGSALLHLTENHVVGLLQGRPVCFPRGSLDATRSLQQGRHGLVL